MTKWLLVLALAGCHEKQEVTPPPPPLRPQSEPPQKTSAAAKDCEPTDPQAELKPYSFDQRSIPESTKLADQATAELKTANGGEVDRRTHEEMLTQAVQHFIDALKADPYDVKATYGLAAAYAKIGRTQCSINLLTRILQMRPHQSKHAEVEATLDRLLGRKQVLDPDFADMRGDQRFRELIKKMCEGTNDPNCVYGGQAEGRER
ncbi:MAG: hypothetical protein JO257_38395 [Deltaproteobacteria bacterium]|nr:hypothetical protein [Deltaproteobacteria bacterium]